MAQNKLKERAEAKKKLEAKCIFLPIESEPEMHEPYDEGCKYRK